jgi:hypothetical protein
MKYHVTLRGACVTVLFLCAASCSDRKDVVLGGGLSPGFDRSDVDLFFSRPRSMMEVVGRFGRPYETNEIQTGMIVYRYEIPESKMPLMQTNYVEEISVMTSNGIAIKHGFVISDTY